jgi:hypothetical protein
MTAYITTREELHQVVCEAFEIALKDQLPGIISEATAKPYLTKEELMELTGWSARTLTNLRHTNQIPYSQHGYKILYPRSGILKFLEDHKISPR